jgi:chaperonin GroEL
MRPEARIADPRTLVLEGIRHLQSILARSLGPAGARVSIETTFGEQLVTRSGADIVGSTSHPDPLARQGITAMARLAHEMAQTAGDGTKLPILLAARILERAFQATTAGHSVREVIGGMEAAVDRANEALATQARPVTGGSLSGVASTAAMDSELGNAITAAIEKAGRDGIVSVDASDSRVRLQITATEGMTLDRGFLRPEFATEAGASMSLLEDCSILIFAGNMSALSECLPLLEKVVQSGRPLLVIGDSVEGEVLATLVLNHQRGILRCAAIRAPGYDAGRQALLQDIAVYTGAKLIDPDIGMTLRGATLDDLGRVRIARITNDSTTLIEGAGRVEAVQARADQIRGEIVSHANDYETEKAHVRLASLQGRIVTILVGGSILAQRNEDRRRLIAGLHSAHAGIRSGWVLGGGVAFVRARAVIKSASERNAGRKLGKQAIERALEEPLRILAGSIGEDETQVLMAVERGLPEAVGLNVATGALEDLAASGILDPTSTLQKALTLALSAAKEVLQTETWEAVEEPHGEGDSHVPQTKPPLG